MDVKELAALLRRYASHRTFIAPSKTWEEAVCEAADALETLAGENERLRKRLEVTTDDAVRAEYRLSKLAPVVEAARKYRDGVIHDGGWACQREDLFQALATLEADHD